MIEVIKKFFAPTIKETESAFYLADKIIELQIRVEELEKENREGTRFYPPQTREITLKYL